MAQGFEITPRKRPTQARALATFDAVVEACARLLSEVGYAPLTTNAIAERAGVGIGSLYEYFPGKDAIVAVVAERLAERVMSQLEQHMERLVRERPDDELMLWLEAVCDTLIPERALIAVFMREVPFAYQLDVSRTMAPRLLAFSQRACVAAGIELTRPAETLLMINNLVVTTLLQVVLETPDGVNPHTLLRQLADRVDAMLDTPT